MVDNRSTSSADPCAADDADSAWCEARRAEIEPCLTRAAVAHGRIGVSPAWHVRPYVSVWAIESLDRPEWVGWWVICGDLPTDLIAAHGLDTPRQALRAFGQRWVHDAQELDRGQVPSAWRHLDSAQLPALADQLRRRGRALQLWADDSASWPEEAG